MFNFYEQLQNMEQKSTVTLATVISGPGVGAKGLWTGQGWLCDKAYLPIFDQLSIEEINNNIFKSGKRTLYLEKLGGQDFLVVCGGGHIAVPVVKIGKMLGFHVIVMDDRPQFTNQFHNLADQVICDSFAHGLEGIQGGANYYFTIVTRGHRYDRLCLEKIIKKQNAYIGMIGSKSRVQMVMEEMVETGIEEERLHCVHAPIGLDIRAQTPEEIAVSIMAEIIQVKRSRQQQAYFFPKDILDGFETYQKVPKCLVTIIGKTGSAPRGVGTKMLVLTDGNIVGSIGGGCVEAQVISIARECAVENKALLKNFDLSQTEAEQSGMVCGGAVEVFFDGTDNAV